MAEQTKVRRKKGEGSIFKRGSRYVIEYKGKTAYADNNREAVDVLNQLKADYAEGYEKLKNPIISDYGKTFLAVKKMSLKPQSYDRLERTFNCQIDTRIGNIKLNDLTNNIFVSKVLTPMKNTDSLSYSSVKKAYDFVNAMYKYAVESRDVKFNPISSMSKPSKQNFDSDDEEDKSTVCFFNDDEKKRFIDECKKVYTTGAYIYQNAYGFILILNTGLREGELLGLPWSMVNFKNKEIKIKYNAIATKQNGKDVYMSVPSTKNSKTRIIKLNKTAIDALQHLKEWQEKNNIDSKYVISNKKGEVVRHNTYIRTFKSICNNASIEVKDYHKIHILRHTFASSLFKKGVDVKIISAILGHSSVKITMDIYIHLIEEQNIKAMDIIDDI